MRVVIVGTSASGKTTLAKRLAREMNLHHIELDALHWGPNWTERPDAHMLSDLDKELANNIEWVTDGNYSVARSRLWGQCTHVVWMNLPLHTNFYLAWKRTLLRMLRRETLWHGNRERFFFLFSKDAIPWWVLRTWKKRREELPREFERWIKADQELLEIRNFTEVDHLVHKLKEERRTDVE